MYIKTRTRSIILSLLLVSSLIAPIVGASPAVQNQAPGQDNESSPGTSNGQGPPGDKGPGDGDPPSVTDNRSSIYSGDLNEDPTLEKVQMYSSIETTWSVMGSGWDFAMGGPPMNYEYVSFSVEELSTIEFEDIDTVSE